MTPRRATVRDATEDDRSWIREQLRQRWGSPVIMSRGRRHEADGARALIAYDREQPVGLLTYLDLGEDEREILTLDAFVSRVGIGSLLIAALLERTSNRTVAVVTTNDNLEALAFYQRCGFRLVELRAGAVDESRASKPSIPLIGNGGIPIRDELVLAKAT